MFWYSSGTLANDRWMDIWPICPVTRRRSFSCPEISSLTKTELRLRHFHNILSLHIDQVNGPTSSPLTLQSSILNVPLSQHMTTSPESSANEPIQPDNLPPPCPPVAETRTEHITPYDDLLARNQALETSNKALKSQITTLQSKNEYWTRLYTYVEKGIAIKITELTNLQEENNQLKVLSSSPEFSNNRQRTRNYPILSMNFGKRWSNCLHLRLCWNGYNSWKIKSAQGI